MTAEEIRDNYCKNSSQEELIMSNQNNQNQQNQKQNQSEQQNQNQSEQNKR